MDTVVTQIAEKFKSRYGTEISDADDLFRAERNLLAFLMELGCGVMGTLFEQMPRGYEGARIERNGKEYTFIGYRTKTLHGLFGMIDYTRAYYFSSGEQGGGCCPMDEQLGVEKRHTPGCQYFLSSFTAREAYEKSLERFHEIFRPAGRDLISMRKALDMDAQLGTRLEQLRQEEIREVYEEGAEPAKQSPIAELMAVSVDATKVRRRGQEERNEEGQKRYPTVWRDVKIGAVSSVSWDVRRQEAVCRDSSYVSSIEYADAFFKRLTVEIMRRSAENSRPRMVFIADGAKWIWDRFAELAGQGSVFILDYYHACEHVSDLCKALYGEQTPQYWKHFTRWKGELYAGKVGSFLKELHTLLNDPQYCNSRDRIQGEINYFTENKARMRYDRYRAAKLPIGSGTIESACKNVIGGRMKQSGMTWSERGADGMLQIRSSIASDRHQHDFRATLELAA